MLHGFVALLLLKTGALRLIWRLLLDRRVPLLTKMVIPAAILYFLSPVDFLPDFIPLAGWIDDLLVLVFSSAFFIGSVPREVLREHMASRGGDKAKPGDKNGKTIEGEYKFIDEDENR